MRIAQRCESTACAAYNSGLGRARNNMNTRSSNKKRALPQKAQQPKKAKPVAPRDITHVLAIDVEAAGPNVIRHFMPEFGAAIFKIGEWQKPLSTFYRALEQKNSGLDWDVATLAEYWHNPDKGIACYGDGGRVISTLTQFDALEARRRLHGTVPANKAAREFVAWARSMNDTLGDDERMIVVTDTGAFDTVWINVMLGRADKEEPAIDCAGLNYLFGKYRPVRDLSSLYFGMAHRFARWGSERAALDKLGLPDFPDQVKAFAHDHNPLNDALSIGASAAYLLSYCE